MKNTNGNNLQNKPKLSTELEKVPLSDSPCSTETTIEVTKPWMDSDSETRDRGSATDNNLPQPSKTFLRTTHWKLRDLDILLGSDLMVFGTEGGPMLSLKLQEATKPMNAVTCLDYWLDNVMAGAPELAICYHNQGIVQGYQLLKTEELPTLHQPPFHPGIVEEFSYSLLRFLQANCTKDAATYWVYKDYGDSIIKLYDLSQIYSPSSKQENIFGYPLAMLFYRMANKLIRNTPVIPEKKAKQRTLFMKCCDLLDEEQHPELWASVAENIAATFESSAADTVKPNVPLLKYREEDNPFVSDCTFLSYVYCSEENCLCAIHYLSQAVMILKDRAPKQTKPKQREFLVKARRLKEKLSQFYFTLSWICSQNKRLGAALRWIQKAGECTSVNSHQGPISSLEKEQRIFVGKLFGLSGDIYFQIPWLLSPSTLSDHQRDTNFQIGDGSTPVDSGGENAKQSWNGADSGEQLKLPLPKLSEPLSLDPETNLKLALINYQRACFYISPDAFASSDDFRVLTKRIGNVQNELGVLYMNTGRTTKAACCLQQGIDSFRTIGDQANVALVNCNLGRLMRLQAEDARRSVPSGCDMTPMEEENRIQAIRFYREALSVLSASSSRASANEQERHAREKILLSVYRDLGGTYYSFALRLLEPATTLEETRALDRRVEEYLHSALQFYELAGEQASHSVAFTHAALARHHASLLARRMGKDTKTHRATKRKLVQRHCDQALALLNSQTHPDEHISVTLEIVRVYICFEQGKRLKDLFTSLRLLLNTHTAFSALDRLLLSSPPDQRTRTEQRREELAQSVVGEVGEVCKQLVRASQKGHQNLQENCKALYRAFLLHPYHRRLSSETSPTSSGEVSTLLQWLASQPELLCSSTK